VNAAIFIHQAINIFLKRRKTLRNSLKTLNLSDGLREDEVFNLRPEQLSVEQFIALTQKIEADGL
jgi:16S rRNA (adenine1518-N6/adenine1519-N6)-dimethyltransferase